MGYIDPNTGGMLFQILAAAFTLITGAALFFSSRIRAWLGRLRRASQRTEAEENEQKDKSA